MDGEAETGKGGGGEEGHTGEIHRRYTRELTESMFYVRKMYVGQRVRNVRKMYAGQRGTEGG